MKLKYAPCKSNKDTVITITSAIAPEVIEIDGEELGPFDADGVNWPNINKETEGKIAEAHRENGELCLTVPRFYKTSCADWDTGAYHDTVEEAKAAEAATIAEYLKANGVSGADAEAAAAEVVK